MLRWCQGKVKHEIKGSKYPTVMVKWGKMSDIKGWEKGGDKEQVLRNHLYNKDKKGAWRRDVDIEIVREVNKKPSTGGADDCASLLDKFIAMEDGSDDGIEIGDSSKSEASGTDSSESESESESERASDDEGV